MKPLAQMRAAPLTRHNSSGDSNVAMIDILGREFLSYGGSSVRSTMVGQKRYNTPFVAHEIFFLKKHFSGETK